MRHKKSFTKLLFKGFWPYWVGGILLGVLNVILTIIYKPWGITAAMTTWGFKIWSFLGGHPMLWTDYLNEVGYDLFLKNPIFNEETLLDLGLIVGVLLASLLAAEFRIKLPKSGRQILLGLLGGLLMGYGARLALGCNIGAMVGGIASQSLHGWVSGLFMFLGAFVGSIILGRYLFRTK